MKKLIQFSVLLILSRSIVFFSCKKEQSCEGCVTNNNKPPTAVAGPDQVITLPTDSVSLDGRTSSDPDGMISVWLWTKISGPASFNSYASVVVYSFLKEFFSSNAIGR